MFQWREVKGCVFPKQDLRPKVTSDGKPSGVTTCHAAERMPVLYWFSWCEGCLMGKIFWLRRFTTLDSAPNFFVYFLYIFTFCTFSGYSDYLRTLNRFIFRKRPSTTLMYLFVFPCFFCQGTTVCELWDHPILQISVPWGVFSKYRLQDRSKLVPCESWSVPLN